MITKIGDWVKNHREWLWTGALVGLAAWPAYNLGLLRAQRGSQPLQEASVFQVRDGIVPRTDSQGQGSTSGVDKSDPRVVISKSATSMKYHHVWCAGAKQIKESNRVWFPSAADAQAAGYSLAGNCSE
ncbi:MAG TPA: hypothetical protein VJ553_02735 [Candidatus Paceibacterota bacterium]|nr:hypothetical protein [Candidatus Paceibacterota bacterium]